jgi:hypothetical protein
MNNSEITIDNSQDSIDLYETLKKEIVSNENLSETDRLVYYKLHLTVASPDDYIFQRLLRRLLNEKTFNPRYILSDEERMLLYKILEKKRIARGLDRHEYRYYCFLVWKYELPTDAECPFVPDIIEIDFLDFEKKFSVGDRRVKLFVALRKALKLSIELYKTEEMEFIVGGSLVDLEKDHPSDVDLILLLDSVSFAKDIRPAKSDTVMRESKDELGKKQIDIVKLFLPLNYAHYMVYELLTLEGNAPEMRTKGNDMSELKTNSFRPRTLYKIKAGVSML